MYAEKMFFLRAHMELFDFPTYKKNLTKLSNFHLKNCKYSRNMSQLPQKKCSEKKVLKI